MYGKMLKAINLYSFHNDTSERNFTLNVIPTNLECMNRVSSNLLSNKITFLKNFDFSGSFYLEVVSKLIDKFWDNNNQILIIKLLKFLSKNSRKD